MTTADKVIEMYNRFPYPSAEVGREKLKEQAYLLQVFALENKLDLTGARILDAGTGTGHRLAQVAKSFPSTQFTAVDFCPSSIEIAKKVSEQEGLTNVTHMPADLMGNLEDLGTFDLVLCIGVLHHLEDPKLGLRNIVERLKPHGAVLLWLYGEKGGRERQRRHQIVNALLGGDGEDYERGIQLVKDLSFDEFEFGWNLNNVTPRERDGLIVDAFLNVNEKLYDANSIHDLLCGSGLAGYAISGITSGSSAMLFDTMPDQPVVLNCKVADLGTHLRTPLLRECFERLDTLDRYRLADLFFSPAGYTVVGFSPSFIESIPLGGRLQRNLICL